MSFLNLAGKRFLIMGVANRKSVAWAITKQLEAEGAEVIHSVRSEARLESLQKLLDGRKAYICDVEFSEQITALAEQVPQLPLTNTTIRASAATPAETTNTNPDERTWNTLLDDLWTGFKSTVRIRRNDQPVQAMLPPEQQFFLQENLRLYLETARLALARTDPVLYRDSLNQAKRLLRQHFNEDHPTTQAMNKTVSELLQQPIHPELPDISESLRSLQSQQQRHTQLSQPLPTDNQSP